MVKNIYPIFLSSLLISSIATSGVTNAYAVDDSNYDSFYDSEFVMEKGVRFTANKELSYHGFMLRKAYEKIKTDYTNISFGTIVFPTYYLEEYGEVSTDSVFGNDSIYTLNDAEAGKIALYDVESNTIFSQHNIEVYGKFDVFLYGTLDLEYTGVSYIKANLYGVDVYRVATFNNNASSLISAAEQAVENEYLTTEIKEAASDVIADFSLTVPDVQYDVETYLDGVLDTRETKTAQYHSFIQINVPYKTGYIFLKTKSNVEGVALANDKAVFKLYFASNPTYKISYYAMDADANYQLIKEITGLTADFYDVVQLTEEQKQLPNDVTLPVAGYKDDYEFSTADSIVYGVNDGDLNLRVCYKVSSRISSNMRRTNGIYQLSAYLGNDVPYGYLMCGIFATTAVFSVRIPKELITLGGGNPSGGITFTNGSTLPDDTLGLRKAGDWVAMDIGLHVKGLKTSNNIDQHSYARCAEITDAPQNEALYYDKVNKDTNPTLINDQDRVLTVVLHNDRFYVYIDETLVTVFTPNTTFFMPKAPTTLQPRFQNGDSYMFGVYMGARAATSAQVIGIKELYDVAALTEIQNNSVYGDIVL